MPRTQNDLIQRSLEMLNALAAGQSPSPEDGQNIRGHIASTLPRLEARGILYVPEVEEIDDEVFEDLATLVADSARPSYGQPRDPDQRLRAEWSLREMQGGDGAGTNTIRATYY